MSIEVPIDFKEKFGDAYPIIEASGVSIHWFKDRDKVFGLHINLDGFDGHELESMSVYIKGLTEYILMPAIEDNFSDDKLRDEWLRGQKEINKVYSYNRLRGNNISSVTFGIYGMKNIFSKIGDERAEDFNTLLKEIKENGVNDNLKKRSVKFADSVAGSALKALELLV